MTAPPLVSVGVPVHNGAPYLADTITSLLAQDLEDFELIISDNASTDGTESICRDALASDPRVRYHRMAENRGAARNYNRAFEMSRGAFFTWAAHDDRRAPEHLSRCVRGFEDNDPSTVLVYPRARFIDADGRDLGPDTDVMATDRLGPVGRLRDALGHVNMANAVFGLIRSSALRRTRLIGPFVASDYVLLAELAMLGPIVEIPDVLFERRLHERSSREATTTLRDVQHWFDPARPGPRLSTRQRLWIEYSRSARRLTPSTGQRWASLVSIPQVMLTRRARIMGGRWKQRLTNSERIEASDWRNVPRTDADPIPER